MTFFEGEAEDEKITIKSYICAANIHRQKKMACSEPRGSEVPKRAFQIWNEVRHTIKVRVTGGK